MRPKIAKFDASFTELQWLMRHLTNFHNSVSSKCLKKISHMILIKMTANVKHCHILWTWIWTIIIKSQLHTRD